MGDFADDLSMDYSQEEDIDEREMCYCGRMVYENQRVFKPGETFTKCIYCINE